MAVTVAATPGRGERGVAVAGGDVEHALAGGDVDGLAERLAGELQRGADDGVVARGPGALLARLDGVEVDGVVVSVMDMVDSCARGEVVRAAGESANADRFTVPPVLDERSMLRSVSVMW